MVLEHGRTGLPLESQLGDGLANPHQQLLAGGSLDVGRAIEADLASANPDKELLILLGHSICLRRRTRSDECAPASGETNSAAVVTFRSDFGPCRNRGQQRRVGS